MELMPKNSRPCVAQLIAWIGRAAQPVRGDAGPFSRVPQLFVSAVPVLHGSLRCVAANTMRLHDQFAFINRQGGIVLRTQILCQLIRRCIQYARFRACVAQGSLNPLDRSRVGRPAHITNAEISEPYFFSVAKMCEICVPVPVGCNIRSD